MRILFIILLFVCAQLGFAQSSVSSINDWCAKASFGVRF